MAWRLGDLVVRGEVFNLRRNSVHGWLELRDHEQPLHFELTGNCSDELAGRHFRFEAREGVIGEETDEAEPRDLAQLEPMQIGPTGDMCLRQARIPRCSTEEFLRRCRAGEQPPCDLKTCLHLEWFSQNGRLVLELVDPELEFVAGPTPAYLAAQQSEAERKGEDADAASPFVTGIRSDEDGEAEVFDPLAEDEEEDDPYGLFPKDLDEQLATGEEGGEETDESAARVEYPPEIDEETRQQWALWDEMLEGKHDVPIQTIFDPPLRIYPPDKLDDAQVAEALRLVLARLAEYGIALDMCQHYSPRDAYRLLLEEILPKHGTYPKLRATGFVQHYMTSEYCEKCDADFETEWQAREQERLERGDTFDPPPDDELPF